MARPVSSKKTIKKNVLEELKSLRLYCPEKESVVDVYAGMLAAKIELESRIDVHDYIDRTDAVVSLENLSKNILAYAKELGLTPAANKRVQSGKKEPAKSGLAVVMRGLTNGETAT